MLKRKDPFKRRFDAPRPSGKSDMPRMPWTDIWLPPFLRPFARLARLDRPIGTWLLLLPGWWAIILAGFGVPDKDLMVLFLIGAIVMRGAGCTYNDIIDRDIDAKVERTAKRPLPSGQVSLGAAWIFLGLQLAIGLYILLQLNTPAIIIGAASLLLVFSYPFMKRITYWPQAWLGLTFNWGVLLGWAAVRGTLDWTVLPLYAAGFFWTLGYDTIYAHQDREDDALVGVKSSALALERYTKPFVALMYLLAIALIVFASTRLIMPGWPALALLGAAGLHLAWQVLTLDIDDPANCLRRFQSNRDFGLLVFASLMLQRL
jgi:4-hydroxybenzoate polyprenyltransferase